MLLLEAAGISIDRMPMLHVVFDRVANACSEYFRQISSLSAFMLVDAITINRVSDYLKKYDGQTIAAIFYATQWETNIIIGLNRRLIYMLIEILFGGDGNEAFYYEDRAFSNIEQKICLLLIQHAGTALSQAFSSIAKTEFQFERIETRMEFLIMGQNNSLGVVAQLNLQSIDQIGQMYIIIPQAAITPIRQKLSSNRISDNKPDHAWHDKLYDELKITDFKIDAHISQGNLTLSEVSNWKVGDLVKLDATPKSLITVTSQDRDIFLAHLGQSDGRYTIRIEEIIDKNLLDYVK